MAFGAVRGAYKAPCKFFSDDPVADNQIIWYYVPDDRQIYEGWSVFWPRVDTAIQDANSRYEREGLGLSVRQHYNGNDVYNFEGTHVHGDEEDFQGLTLRKKYYVGGIPPLPPCGAIGVMVRLGFDVLIEEVTGVSCACCEGTFSPAVFDMEIEAPDYPEFDGLILSMGYREDSAPLCHWDGATVIEGHDFLAVAAAFEAPGGVGVTLQSESPAYGGMWQVVIGPMTEFTCEPWAFFGTGEVTDDMGATGNMVTVRTPVDGGEGSILVGLALAVIVESPAVTIVHNIGLELGVEIIAAGPVPTVNVPLSLAVLVEEV